jgi:D-cysteine desulfhydrase
MQQPVRFVAGRTPVEQAPRLAAALGLGPDDLLVKRDDLIGLGGGGNKVRKLEITCSAALDVGAHTLVTTGAPQSNHARLTAAAGARLGLDVLLVLAGEPPAPGGTWSWTNCSGPRSSGPAIVPRARSRSRRSRSSQRTGGSPT